MEDEERRRHLRTESDLSASIQWTSRRFDGVIRNVSDDGAFVCCDHRLLPGECVRIAVKPKDCAPMVFDAEVVWSRILGRDDTYGSYGIGFRFLDVCLTQKESGST
jgi:hypothetical protein